MRFVKKVNERGVLTLPAEVREALGVDEGDIVEFEVLNVIKKKGSSDAQSPAPAEETASTDETQETATYGGEA